MVVQARFLYLLLSKNLMFVQMESVIKQAEQSKSRSVENAKRIHADFIPLKAEVDRLRQSCLGLERLPELHEEEPSILSSE